MNVTYGSSLDEPHRDDARVFVTIMLNTGAIGSIQELLDYD